MTKWSASWNIMNKLIQTVTLCKKMGKLILGFDLVKKAMITGKAQLVLLACDLSPKTIKEAGYLCQQFDTPICHTPLTLDEYWYLIGKRVGVIAVTDQHFAKKLETILNVDAPVHSDLMQED